ncbi:hypothetical protein JCGZ_18649 [Jatropha curcas]|uniref:Uncharacterized protein n=1 Tax=Jatropha curcas TaxID=180498 RepID=A0A067KD34_JATCU|nr:hypothetical protein JCGZ_18649 [Jatropha curcas]
MKSRWRLVAGGALEQRQSCCATEEQQSLSELAGATWSCSVEVRLAAASGGRSAPTLQAQHNSREEGRRKKEKKRKEKERKEKKEKKKKERGSGGGVVALWCC